MVFDTALTTTGQTVTSPVSTTGVVNGTQRQLCCSPAGLVGFDSQLEGQPFNTPRSQLQGLVMGRKKPERMPAKGRPRLGSLALAPTVVSVTLDALVPGGPARVVGQRWNFTSISFAEPPHCWLVCVLLSGQRRLTDWLTRTPQLAFAINSFI